MRKRMRKVKLLCEPHLHPESARTTRPEALLGMKNIKAPPMVKGALTNVAGPTMPANLPRAVSIAGVMRTNIVKTAEVTRCAPRTATAFSRARSNSLKLQSVPKPYMWRGLSREVGQFYGAVGGVLCTTLWDPGCSHNFVTPAFADVLSARGARWKWCDPLHVDHGVGESGGVGSAAPAVRSLRADVVLKHKGLTYMKKQALFYVYPGTLPDVMLCRKELESLPCLEQPGSKLLDWEMTKDDLEGLAHIVDASIIQAYCVMQPGVATSNHADVKPISSRPDVQAILKEMCEQREKLRERIGKAVSAEAAAAVEAVIDRYPDNFRPPGCDPCKLGVFSIKLKDNAKSFVCLDPQPP